MPKTNEGLGTKNRRRLGMQGHLFTLPCTNGSLWKCLMRSAALRRDLTLSPFKPLHSSQRQQVWHLAAWTHIYLYFRPFLAPQEMGKRQSLRGCRP